MSSSISDVSSSSQTAGKSLDELYKVEDISFKVKIPSEKEEAKDSVVAEKDTKPSQSIQLSAHQKDVSGFFFLPSKKYVRAKLIYLTLVKENTPQFPVTKDQEAAFRISKLADREASNCLCCGCGLLIAASALSGGTLGPGCLGSSQWILNSLATIGNVASAGFSYLSTGIYPDKASNKANTKQNHYHEAEEEYASIGIDLIELNEEDPQFGEEVAKNLKIRAISDALKQVLTADEAKVIVRPLRKARKFVLKGKIPETPASIHNCVTNVLLKRELNALKTQLALTQKDSSKEKPQELVIEEETTEGNVDSEEDAKRV